MMPLHWNKCTGDAWCGFLDVNLDHPHFFNLEAVYVIWLGGSGQTIYVGSGHVAERLKAHRLEPWVHKYALGHLLVSWAVVPSLLQKRVERYLAETLEPAEGQRHPVADPPIEVTLPGAPPPPVPPPPLPPR